jgi:hypothetical protein
VYAIVLGDGIVVKPVMLDRITVLASYSTNPRRAPLAAVLFKTRVGVSVAAWLVICRGPVYVNTSEDAEVVETSDILTTELVIDGPVAPLISSVNAFDPVGVHLSVIEVE